MTPGPPGRLAWSRRGAPVLGEAVRARLLRIGADAVLLVLVERPPQTLELAQRVAAEHCAFADEIGGSASYTVGSVAASLVGVPLWTFWWD